MFKINQNYLLTMFNKRNKNLQHAHFKSDITIETFASRKTWKFDQKFKTEF